VEWKKEKDTIRTLRIVEVLMDMGDLISLLYDVKYQSFVIDTQRIMCNCFVFVGLRITY